MILPPALLFCPADRPDRFHKAAAAADAVILDLEDAVGPASKAAARAALIASDLDPATTVVRVNAASSGHQERDLEAVKQTSFRTVMLSKAEARADLRPFRGFDVIALCETPRGVRNAFELATDDCVIALFWGPEDLTAALGGTSSRYSDGALRDVARVARANVLLSAGAAGKSAYDTVYLDIANMEGLRKESEDAASSGFVGKVSIHPSQVDIVRAAFSSDEESAKWAHRVLEVATNERGVFTFEGRMIDEPVLRQARLMVERYRVDDGKSKETGQSLDG